MQYDSPATTLGVWERINARNFFAGAGSLMSAVIGVRSVTVAAMLGRPVNRVVDIEPGNGIETHFTKISLRLVRLSRGGDVDFRFLLPEDIC
jgi:hypothetical protein